MEQSIRQPNIQSAGQPVNSHRIKWWLWLIFALVIIVFGGGGYYLYATRIPCGTMLGGHGLPCTNNHKIDQNIVLLNRTIIPVNNSLNQYEIRTTAVDTDHGIIYKTSYCQMVFDAGNDYFNADGEYIANCNGGSYVLEPLGRSGATCKWLNEQFINQKVAEVRGCTEASGNN